MNQDKIASRLHGLRLVYDHMVSSIEQGAALQVDMDMHTRDITIDGHSAKQRTGGMDVTIKVGPIERTG